MKKSTRKLKLNRETVRFLEEPTLTGIAAAATNTGVCCTVATHACSACLPCA